jgi:hypothetical protein
MSPIDFQWGKQQHKIDNLLHQWRVDMAWWRDRVWRDYYKLTTTSGLLVVIYQDLDSKEWFLQRLYD